MKFRDDTEEMMNNRVTMKKQMVVSSTPLIIMDWLESKFILALGIFKDLWQRMKGATCQNIDGEAKTLLSVTNTTTPEHIYDIVENFWLNYIKNESRLINSRLSRLRVGKNGVQIMLDIGIPMGHTQVIPINEDEAKIEVVCYQKASLEGGETAYAKSLEYHQELAQYLRASFKITDERQRDEVEILQRTDVIPQEEHGPWERIEDKMWDREAVQLWHAGYTCKQIMRKMGKAGEERIRNRLSELRKEHGDEVVPYNKQRRRRGGM